VINSEVLRVIHEITKNILIFVSWIALPWNCKVEVLSNHDSVAQKKTYG